MVKSLFAAVLAFLVLSAGPASAKPNSFAQKDAAGNLLAHLTEGEDLKPKRGKDSFGIPNSDLVFAVSQGADGKVSMRFAKKGGAATALPVPLTVAKGAKLRPWPLFVQLSPAAGGKAPAYLLGVLVSRSQGYSGGGASEEWLHLFRVDKPGAADGRAAELLSLPVMGDKIIRACFNAEDEVRRNGACHDSYKYEAHLRLDTQNDKGWPALIYQSKASAAPGPLAWPGKLPDRPLTSEEVAEKDDFICGFRRGLNFSDQTKRYEMRAPGPNCADYFLPR